MPLIRHCVGGRRPSRASRPLPSDHPSRHRARGCRSADRFDPVVPTNRPRWSRAVCGSHPDRTGPQIDILLLCDGTDGRKAVVDWLGSETTNRRRAGSNSTASAHSRCVVSPRKGGGDRIGNIIKTPSVHWRCASSSNKNCSPLESITFRI